MFEENQEPYFTKDCTQEGGYSANPANSHHVARSKEDSETPIIESGSFNTLRPSTVSLYPKQQTLVQLIRKSFAAGNESICTQASTGFGKSIVLGYICRGFVEKQQAKGSKQRVVISVDSLTLIDQLLNTLENMFGLEVGVIQGFNERFNLDAQVQIATPQTLTRRFASDQYGSQYRNYNVGLLLVDESHVQHRGIAEAKEHWQCNMIGFTATPYAKGMGLVYDSLVKADPLSKLMEDGDLTKYIAYSHAAPDFTGCKTSANGDIQADDKYDDGLIGDVFKTWHSQCKDRLTIGFASSKKKAQAFSELFNKNGVPSQAIYSGIQNAGEIVEDFKSGKTRVLWSVAMLVKGFDVPECSCLIDCQPTRSLMRHVQKGGRVLRKHPGKETAIILDHAGNMQRNGFFEDIHIDELDTGNKEDGNPDRAKTEPKVINCPACKAEIKPAKTCPHCQHELGEVSIREKPDEIGWEEGELVEMNRSAGKRNKQATWEEKQMFIGGLKWIAANKGYKSGWVANKYRAQFGVWPNDSRVKNYPAKIPTAEVQRFIDNGRKAYFIKANAKRKAVAA